MKKILVFNFNLSKFFCLFVIAAMVLSCRKQEESPVEGKAEMCAPIFVTRTNIFCEINSVGMDGGLSYEDTFKHLVTATNLTLTEAGRATDKLVQKISQIPDTKEALLLYDRLLEMAISQEVSITEYNRRQNWFYMLWWDAFSSFIGAQHIQGNDFAYWDKIFRFYAKYTNEIVSVENELSKVDRLKWNRSMVLKGGYLHGIKGELKTWVRVMRDFEFPKMSKNYTSEQKADILRRFKEVEKYTVTPPHFPGGRSAK